jgi:hypothetical protein
MVGEAGVSYWFAKPAGESPSEFESHIIRQVYGWYRATVCNPV